MIRDDIVKYFLINSDNRNIPYVSSKHWKVFKEKYKKEDIRESLANYIVSNDVPFPIKKIPEKIFRKTGHLESRGGNLTFDAEELIKNNLNEDDKSNFDENPYLKFHSGSDLA